MIYTLGTMPERLGAEIIQLATFNNPMDNSGYGEGPMQNALINYRCKTAERVIESKCFEKNCTILDAGSGQGIVTDYVASRFPENTVVGIDIASLRLKHELKEGKSGEYVIGRVQALPLENESINAVLAYEIFEHLTPDDSLEMLGEFHRVLCPDGILILSTPNGNSLSHKVRSLVKRSDGGQSHREDHFNEVASNDLLKIVTGEGFNVEEKEGIGLIPGMWRMQSLLPQTVHCWNLRMGKKYFNIASETLVVASRTTSVG